MGDIAPVGLALRFQTPCLDIRYFAVDTFIMVKKSGKESSKSAGSVRSFRTDASHVRVLKRSAREAVAEALRVSRALLIPITYLEGAEIVKRYPDGSKEIIGRLDALETSGLAPVKKGDIIDVRRK